MKDLPVPFWDEGRKYSKSEALMDYLYNTDCNPSERELAERWRWSRYEVRVMKVYVCTKFQPNFNHLSDYQSTIKALFSTKFQPKINQEKSNKKSSLVATLKKIFDEGYKSVYNEDFYWTAKDTKALKEIIQKLQFKMKAKNIELTDEHTINSFNAFLNNITDKWILANFSPSIINSKFNEIITQIYARHTKQSSSVESAAIDLLRKDECR